MRPRQRPPARLRVEREIRGRHVLDDDRPLHVAKLAPVEEAVLFNTLGPPEEDVTRGLHHPLAINHALARLLEATLRKVVLEHGPGRLFDLQEERVLLIPALEQHDERARPYAPDADDFASDIDDLEAFQEMATVVLQGAPVGAELLVEHVSH